MSTSAAWGRTKSLRRLATGVEGVFASAVCEANQNIGTSYWAKAIVLAVLLFSFSVVGFAESRKLSEDLENVSTGDVDVIIQFKVPATADDFNKIEHLGGRLKRDLRGPNKEASFHLRASALQALASMSEVEHVSMDHKVSATSASPDFYVAAANAMYLDSDYDGSGIGVAVIDSGIAQSNDFSDSSGSHIVYGQSFVPGDSSTGDGFGHGTHVAGIVGGTGRNSNGSSAIFTFKGIARNVRLINLRVLDNNGISSDSTVIAAIQTAIALKSQYNIRVINLSLGRPVFESYKLDPLCQAVESAWKAGIVVVVAAGNMGRYTPSNGYATITAPGNDPYAITVGAMKPVGTPDRRDDLIASYSSKGPTLLDHVVKPDLLAAGNRVISVGSPNSQLASLVPETRIPLSYYQSMASSELSNDYVILNGTSMAAPVVTGAAALVLQKNPQLTPDQVKARLMKTAYKTFPVSSTAIDPVSGVAYVSYYDLFTVGAGYLDISAALANSDVAPGNIGAALSPSVQYDPVTGTVTLVNGSSVVWGQSLVWGQSVVWGQTVLSGTSVVWGQSVCWGNSTVAGFTVVWGQSVVWGLSDPMAESTSIAINGEN